MIATLLPWLYSLVTVVLAAIILWRTEPALNRMSRSTHSMVRYAVLLLAAGALAMILYTLAGDPPNIATLLLSGGIALMLICERRVRVLIPPQKGERHAA